MVQDFFILSRQKNLSHLSIFQLYRAENLLTLIRLIFILAKKDKTVNMTLAVVLTVVSTRHLQLLSSLLRGVDDIRPLARISLTV